VLFTVAVANFALAVLFTALMHVDGRTLLGRNVWTKPWKFATSIAIFTATMGWIMPSLSLTERVERLTTYIIGGAMSIEIVLISMQAARGVASHFNTTTPLDSAVFGIMGITITISSVAVGYVLWRVVRNPPNLAPAYQWGLGLGMFLFVVASFQGWLMVFHGGHAVGAANDSPGLPLLNWSVTGGDLRVAHFIGLHALQILPLTGYVAVRWDRVSARQSLATVGLVGTGYGLLSGMAFVLALLGTPLVRSPTLLAVSPAALATVLLIGTVLGTVVLTAVLRVRGED
jgi:NADH:ubiquinone oxidoreductase subunit K